MVYCPECGLEISSEDIFCGNCGIALTPVAPVSKDIKYAPISEDEANDDASLQSANLTSNSTEENLPVKITEDKQVEFGENNFPSGDLGKPESADENLTPPASLPGIEFAFNLENKNKEEKPPEQTTEPGETDEEDWEVKPVPVQTEQNLSEPEKEPEAKVSTPEFSENKEEPKVSFAENEENPLSFSKDLSELKADTPSDSFSSDVTPAQPPFPEDLSFGEFKQSGSTGLEKVEGNNPAAQNENFVEENKVSANVEKDLPNESQIEPPDQDFQATMPYTPTDFAEQKIVAGKISEEQVLEASEPNKLSPADSEKFAVGEDAAPIAPPDVPVGSSQHGSLEPTSISVQIYDPKQKFDESENPTLLGTSGNISPIIDQTKSEPERESRPYTSQNIGGNDTDGKSKAKLKPLDEGTILNARYEVVRKIGGGGMGAVYLASDKNLGGISRAVKEMVQSYIEDSQQEKAVNDFRRESMLLTSLEHPSIPTIFDYFFDDKEARFYLVMKYISGGDLAARLRAASEGKIDEATVTEWGIQLADVLDYLHNRQPPIVYRDLKPSNIMIDGNTGKVMLIDFGIARWVNKEEKGVTAVGTMGYAPPELFSGNVEPRSDIYSLGSTMFHLLTGADPQSNPLLIFDFNKHPRPRQINSQLTDQMEQILMRMVEYTAAKRFSSAAELREVLISHLDNLKKGQVTIGVAESQSSSSPVSNQPVFCGFCGQKILAADVFCPFCGAQQTAPGQAAPFVQPKATARLVIMGTNELDSPIFKLEKENNLVGRRDPMSNIFPEVDLSKFDPQTKISRRHARIWRDRESFMVEDLGSSNGTTIINRGNESQKLGKNQPHVLTSGDRIRVGDTTLHFVFD